MTDTETTTEDFQATKTFASDPTAVFAALTDLDALTAWWTPAAGGGSAGDTLRFLMGDDDVVMRVDEAVEPSSVRWRVLECPVEEDWVGTSITFGITPAGTGSELSFRHEGLTRQLPCFDRCRAFYPPADAERIAAWRARHAAA